MTPFDFVTYLVGLPTAAYFAFVTARAFAGEVRTVRALRPRAESGRTQAATADTSRTGAHPAAGPEFVILMPMLREDRVVREACEHLVRAVKDGVALQVVIATTEREEQERREALAELRAAADRGGLRHDLDQALTRALVPAAHAPFRHALETGRPDEAVRIVAERQRPTTAETAADVIAELNASLGREVFHHTAAPATATGKVGQLNAALRRWQDGRDRARDVPVYVGVYDADSKPDPAAFRAMADIVHAEAVVGHEPPEIFQQVSSYCRGMGAMRGMRAALRLSDAIAQTRWALGFEYDLFRRYTKQARAAGLRPLAYCIGHGCFVSLGFLERIGGFPTLSPNDDLALGYEASLLGAQVCPVPALDYCDVAPDSLSSVRQSRFWFHGSARFATDLRAFRDELGVRPGRLQWWYLLAVGHGRNIAWAWRAAAWVTATALAAADGRWALTAVLVALHLAYVQGGFLQTWRHLHTLPGAADLSGVREFPVRLLLASLAAASVTFVVRSLGPLTGSLELLLRRGGVTSWKVER
ncbi:MULTISPECIES: glycosyltransferase [unclassified Streptomyces]|uniref:glycosyltransferase n=1 Tax=unclassified Streptomyces TaxID=2593676 RepID=UPI0034448BA2